MCAEPRGVVERALLLLAAWLPAPRDGDRLRTARMRIMQRADKLLDRGPPGGPPGERCMFTTRQQALERVVNQHT